MDFFSVFKPRPRENTPSPSRVPQKFGVLFDLKVLDKSAEILYIAYKSVGLRSGKMGQLSISFHAGIWAHLYVTTQDQNSDPDNLAFFSMQVWPRSTTQSVA